MSELDVPRIQNRLLTMAVAIASTLEKHDIPYMIAFGTLLGAIRHNGFIPWDDDFDFFLFADSYDEAITVLRSELPSDMFVEDGKSEPKYFHAWAHVKDVNTICECAAFPQDSLYAHQGISVDLYKITKMRECDVANFRLHEGINYLDRRLKLGFITKEDYDRRLSSFEKRHSEDRSDSNRDVLAYPSDIGRYYIEDVLPLKKYSFAGHQFYGPGNSDHILTACYGDYMSLPPEEDRHPHYSRVEFLENKSHD